MPVTSFLLPLLDQLSTAANDRAWQWKDWLISPIHNGANNRLFRATSPHGDFAVKFTLRDRRARSSREYQALRALRAAGLEIAPQPVWLDTRRYALPVVVQTWLEGESSALPPTNPAEWGRLLEHYAAVHSLTPGNSRVRLRKAVLNFNSAAAGMRAIRQQAARLPTQSQPASPRALLRNLEEMSFPAWGPAPACLCRNDPNLRNMLRRPGQWGSVDWENSGWGDPAFEIADLLMHPTMNQVSQEQRDWAIQEYANLVSDPATAIRIRVYYRILLVWWVARLARYLYEIPRGLDDRLAPRPADWEVDLQGKYEQYLGLASKP